MLTTTLAELRKHNPCPDRLAALVGGLGEGWPDDREITPLQALAILGVDNVLWGLAHVAREHSEARRILQLFALGCAEHVEQLGPPEAAACNAAVRRFLKGAVTLDQLQAARKAAKAAARAACAAWQPAGEAATEAATEAARATWAASQAAKAAAGAACAAWQATTEATWQAAEAAAREAARATWAAREAARATWAAEPAWQTQWLRELLSSPEAHPGGLKVRSRPWRRQLKRQTRKEKEEEHVDHNLG
jgi:hypothetical protein